MRFQKPRTACFFRRLPSSRGPATLNARYAVRAALRIEPGNRGDLTRAIFTVEAACPRASSSRTGSASLSVSHERTCGKSRDRLIQISSSPSEINFFSRRVRARSAASKSKKFISRSRGNTYALEHLFIFHTTNYSSNYICEGFSLLDNYMQIDMRVTLIAADSRTRVNFKIRKFEIGINAFFFVKGRKNRDRRDVRARERSRTEKLSGRFEAPDESGEYAGRRKIEKSTSRAFSGRETRSERKKKKGRRSRRRGGNGLRNG